MSASKPASRPADAAVPLPATLPAVVPYLTLSDTAAAIDFYARAFGATELFRLTGQDGRIGHAEVTIGGSVLMLSDEYPDFGALGPQSIGGSPIKLHLQVADADAALARAVAAGATVVRAAQDQFYGERTALVADPFGYSWFLASRIEDVTPAEMQKRWDAAFAG